MEEKIGKSDYIRKQVSKQTNKTSVYLKTSEKSRHTLGRHLQPKRVQKISIQNI